LSEALAVAERYAAFVSRSPVDIAADLESFARLLAKWQRAQNLVSRETDELWQRHIADSLQLLKFYRGESSVLDLGSGGGFPAVPIAVALKDQPADFTLVESNAKKTAFLRTAGRELGLRLEVFRDRIEAIDPRETPLVTSRALAELPQLLAWSAPWFGPGTRALFHKGRDYREELDKSRTLWQFDVIVHSSDTSGGGVILEISNLRAASKS
jgi:16S rRNA (guanine527-N7)-methyltransferase